MKKIIKSFTYAMQSPARTIAIINLYKALQGRYKITTILAHMYRESYYAKKGINNKHGQERVPGAIEDRPIIVNIHDGLVHSGGLTDRLKGICTLYQFAKTNDYKFKIHFVHPFRLEKYLVPNLYDWSIKDSAVIFHLDESAIYTWEREELAEKFFQLNADKLQLHVACNSAECLPVYSLVFHELFKPSFLLNNSLEYHLQKLGGKEQYIAISLRFQNLLGEFKEANSNALTLENRDILINNCLTAINNIREQHPKCSKVLVTSDSNIFREIATSAYSYIYTFIIPEEIGHMDYADAGKGKELTAFLDMYRISNSAKAYQIRNRNMYNSDFPKMAALISNVQYEMILIS